MSLISHKKERERNKIQNISTRNITRNLTRHIIYCTENNNSVLYINLRSRLQVGLLGIVNMISLLHTRQLCGTATE
jgi:hypothetical protein